MTNTPRPHGLSRRHVLTTGLGVAGAAALWSTGTGGTAHAAPADDSRWRDENSANGWPVVDEADSHRIEGSGLDVRLLVGDVSVVLLHVARRYHYEIHELRRGEVTGHLTERAVAQPYESNHLSGTAIALRPGAHPVGVQDGLFPQQRAAVRHILAECEGVVGWGGDEQTPKESHFEIAVGPGDARLARLADLIRGAAPGRRAGAVNQTVPIG
ncbi:M15 family metallopeptidase [Streptomyces sp. MP131-18]|uniref:M15 family metallopeptidase n=1 Tax=Streptomyces sp. MP131-18 TaxID=1857892 RepID=UPI0009CFA067|nr:M15 family metallopeptidase [Streptomyces sp. MP131-18]ONK10560.1 hypothetical protein STBA_12820 [Streptomyces sp. MP131-18]